MDYHITCIGKPSLEYARIGIETYQKRLSRLSKVTVRHLKKSQTEQESTALLKASEGLYRIALDERGNQLSTNHLQKYFNELELKGISRVALLIGGAEGHMDKLRQQSNWLWALSPMTLQHELALLVLLEQLYRIETIRAGMPYHRN